MQDIVSLTKANGEKALAHARHRCGDFVVHPDILGDNQEWWKVSHVPSGAGMVRCQSFRVACILARVFSMIPTEWPTEPFLTQESARIARLRVTKNLPFTLLVWLSLLGKTNVLKGEIDE